MGVVQGASAIGGRPLRAIRETVASGDAFVC